jgi:hypothetical protein
MIHLLPAVVLLLVSNDYVRTVSEIKVRVA